MEEKSAYRTLENKDPDSANRTDFSPDDLNVKISDSFFSEIFYNAPMLMTISTVKDGRYLEVNKSFTSATGFSREDAVNATSVELGFISRSDRERLRQSLNSKGRIDETYLHLTKKNGDRMVCKYSGKLIELGGEKYLLSIAADITDLKKAEEDLNKALEASKEKLLENSMLLRAARSIPLSENFQESAREIYDICKEHIGGKCGYVALMSEDGENNDLLFLDDGGFPCYVDPDLPMPIRGLREVAYRTQEVVFSNSFNSSEWEKYMPEGHLVLENVLFSPLKFGDHSAGVIGLANKPGGFDEHDVRIAKHYGEMAALALSHSRDRESLAKSEEKYRTLTRNFPNGAVILFDRDLRYLLADGLGLAEADLDGSDMVGRTIWEIFPQETCTLLEGPYRAAFKGKDSIIEVPFSDRIYRVHIHGIQNEDGEVDLGLVMTQDITEQKHAEKLVKDKNIELERINTALNVLLERRDLEKKTSKNEMIEYLKDLVMPYISKADKSRSSQDIKTYLKIAGRNIQEFINEKYEASLSLYSELSPNEIQVASLIKEGKTSKEISDLMNVSPRTVYFHRENIRKKLNLSNKKINLRTFLKNGLK